MYAELEIREKAKPHGSSSLDSLRSGGKGHSHTHSNIAYWLEWETWQLFMIHTWHHGFLIWGKPLPWRCYYFIHTTTDLGWLTGLKWKEPWNDEKTMVSVECMARWTLHTAVSGLTRRVPNTLHATARWAILKTEQDHLTLTPKRGQRFSGKVCHLLTWRATPAAPSPLPCCSQLYTDSQFLKCTRLPWTREPTHSLLAVWKKLFLSQATSFLNRSISSWGGGDEGALLTSQ